jgi:hypothetical protein
MKNIVCFFFLSFFNRKVPSKPYISGSRQKAKSSVILLLPLWNNWIKTTVLIFEKTPIPANDFDSNYRLNKTSQMDKATERRTDGGFCYISLIVVRGI